MTGRRVCDRCLGAGCVVGFVVPLNLPPSQVIAIADVCTTCPKCDGASRVRTWGRKWQRRERAQ